MKPGYLSDHFAGIATKRLSAVEADPIKSNQHEFDGVTRLRELFGTEKKRFSTIFIYLHDDEEHCCTNTGFVTWYDAREKHPKRTEYRLYYESNDVMDAAGKDDLLIIGKRPDESLMVLVAKADSTYENQLLWLFGLHEEIGRFGVKQIEASNDMRLDLAAKYILDELGIESDVTDESWLERILSRFDSFPKTSEFSEFARSTLQEISARENPDLAIMAWLEQEEMLFRTLEKYIVQKRLEKGFSDVDEFISYSLGILNRRKSRAGWALEHHVDYIFRQFNLRYSRGKETENRSRPDFLFPSVEFYHDPDFPTVLLSMLGVKTTCKDRWRQVLAEARKIASKNLLTIEPGISENQTAEMKANSLHLVVPQQIHATYSKRQREWLMNLIGFIDIVKHREKTIRETGFL